MNGLIRVNKLHWRIFAFLMIVATVATLAIFMQKHASLEWLVTQETQLREYVNRHPWQSWFAGFLIYTCLSLVPGTAGKSVIYGWLFGFWLAVLLVDIALTAAAMAAFAVSRFLLRESVESRFGVHLTHLRKQLQPNVGFYLLMLRLLHTPFTFLNYASGASIVVPTRTFWWTTQLGLLPGTMIFVFAGTRIPSLSIIAESGITALLDGPLIVMLAATVLVPLTGKWISSQVRRRSAVRRTDCETS